MILTIGPNMAYRQKRANNKKGNGNLHVPDGACL
jgi:hypothetical protein